MDINLAGQLESKLLHHISEDDASLLGVEVVATDPVELHTLSGQLTDPRRTGSETQLNYSYSGLRPRLNMGLTSELRSRENGALYGRQRNEFRENVTSFRFGVALPLSIDTWSASLNTAYYFTDIRPADNVDPAHDPGPSSADSGSQSLSIARITAISNAQSFENAISKEKACIQSGSTHP